MQRLVHVEEAKTLFNVAKDWSVWRWLTEKKTARRAADRAWAALDEVESRVKAAWNEDFRKAYAELEAEEAMDGDARSKRLYEKAKEEARGVDRKVKLAARRLREADNEAYNARMDAEDKFDEAERHMSAAMAREGAQMAIDAWALREKFIRRAEGAARSGA